MTKEDEENIVNALRRMDKQVSACVEAHWQIWHDVLDLRDTLRGLLDEMTTGEAFWDRAKRDHNLAITPEGEK